MAFREERRTGRQGASAWSSVLVGPVFLFVAAWFLWGPEGLDLPEGMPRSIDRDLISTAPPRQILRDPPTIDTTAPGEHAWTATVSSGPARRLHAGQRVKRKGAASETSDRRPRLEDLKGECDTAELPPRRTRSSRRARGTCRRSQPSTGLRHGGPDAREVPPEALQGDDPRGAGTCPRAHPRGGREALQVPSRATGPQAERRSRVRLRAAPRSLHRLPQVCSRVR